MIGASTTNSLQRITTPTSTSSETEIVQAYSAEQTRVAGWWDINFYF
jgi:hypothetical protein